MSILKLLFRLLLGRRLPITTGTLEIPGLLRPVWIRRDGNGIAYIEAEGDDDAWYGLGFCHGQDRAFQLDGLARIVRGTLAELVGPAGLPVDRLCRRIGFFRSAEQQLEALDDEIRHMLEAYARGVTDGATLGCRRPAHEFALHRTQPTPYFAADALGVLKFISFGLASNWDVELARLKILTEDGPQALMALDPSYPDWLPVTSPPTALAGAKVDRLAEDLAIFTSTFHMGGGSNNWTVAPSRTATGRPILANDPHLAPVLPPHWYLAHVRTPQWAIAGASFLGTPTFPAGHNGKVAWGITAGLLDNTDLFIEEVGSDGRSVREGSQFIPCESRLETIHVRDGEAVEEKFLVTPRGPVVGPALEGEMGSISMRGIWQEPHPAKGLLQLHRVKSCEELRQAFRQWPFLSLNMVCADSTGTVGWQLAGEAPRRRKGWGTIPLPGWDSEVGWEDSPVPFDEMPHLTDPEAGFVATANNQPTPEGKGAFLGMDWTDGYRQARITEALEARRDWDVASTLALQVDQESIPWRELREAIFNAPAETDETRQAAAILQRWDGRVTVESPGAAVFEFFLVEMAQRIAKAKAPRTAQWALGQGFTPLAPHSMFLGRRISHLVQLVRNQPAGWFGRPWPEELADALATAVRRLRQLHGADPNQWAWGRVRQLTLLHSEGERAQLGRLFNLGPIPWGGDINTVSQAEYDFSDPSSNPTSIASLRMVVDVGNWDESRFILPGGQSGNPLSPHYDDQLPLWQRAEGVPIAWSPKKVEEVSQAVLCLKPR